MPAVTPASRDGLDPAAHGDGVDARHLVRRIGDPVGQPRVRGQQEQAGGRQIQPPDGNEARGRIAQHVVDGRPPLGIAPRRHDAPRLVKHDRPPGARAALDAVDQQPDPLGDDEHGLASRRRGRPRSRGRPGSPRPPAAGTGRRASTGRGSTGTPIPGRFSAPRPGVLCHLLLMTFIRRALVVAGHASARRLFRGVNRHQAESRRQRHHRTAAAAHRRRDGSAASVRDSGRRQRGRRRPDVGSTGPVAGRLARPRRHLRVVHAGQDREGAGPRFDLRVHRHHAAAHQRAAARPRRRNARPQGASNGGQITFALTRQPDGNALLRILVPRPDGLPIAIPGPNGDVTPPSTQQIDMVKALLAGARLTVAIEPEGRLVQTSSPFVDGNRVTLIDRRHRQDRGRSRSRRQAAVAEDRRRGQGDAINSIPGLKITLDPGDHDHVHARRSRP